MFFCSGSSLNRILPSGENKYSTITGVAFLFSSASPESSSASAEHTKTRLLIIAGVLVLVVEFFG